MMSLLGQRLKWRCTGGQKKEKKAGLHVTYRGKTQSLGKKESFKSLSDYIVDLSILQSISEDYCSYAIFFHGFD